MKKVSSKFILVDIFQDNLHIVSPLLMVQVRHPQNLQGDRPI